MAAVGRDGAKERDMHIPNAITSAKGSADEAKEIPGEVTCAHHTGLTGNVPGSSEPQIVNTITKTGPNK